MHASPTQTNGPRARAQERAEHGVYGYSVPLEEVTQEVVKYLERTAHYKVRRWATRGIGFS